MLTKEVRTFLYVWVPLTLLLALAYRNKHYIGANPIVRPRLDRIEPFVAAPVAEKPPVEPAAEPSGPLAPADASLTAMRKPYALLGDVLEVSAGSSPAAPDVDAPNDLCRGLLACYFVPRPCLPTSLSA